MEPHGGAGRPRVYCSDRCRWRVGKRAWRRTHPLGWRTLGLELANLSLADMLREIGIDPF